MIASADGGRFFRRVSFAQPPFAQPRSSTPFHVPPHAIVPKEANSEWHSRGYLPHRDSPRLVQALTFRQGDSLAQETLARMRAEIAAEITTQIPPTPGVAADATAIETARRNELIRRVNRHLDTGSGSCALRAPECAKIVSDALLFGDGTRYQLLAWCVMPNHVHVLWMSCGDWSLPAVLRPLKGFTARILNRVRGQSGPFWAKEYFDRFVRSPKHLDAAIDYIERNPVTAGLCASPAEWQWSSASPDCGIAPAELDARRAAARRQLTPLA
jgi:REP element-mobilizing transposase RayT